MIVKVRCPECHGPLDLSKPFNESEWTVVRIKDVGDGAKLKCSKCTKGGKTVKLQSGPPGR